MPTPIPEPNKVPGVCYAWTDETDPTLPYLELPVIDLTHPAFALDTSPEKTDALINQFVASLQRLAQTPPEMLQVMFKSSLLMRGMMLDSANTFTTGMMTYLNKLPADLLGAGYATPFDKQWSGSLTPFTFRWRMRDLSRLLADNLAPRLADRPGAPLRLLNIAGGPAADSLNALILIHKEHPGLLDGREISLDILDLDPHGPVFAVHALAALTAPGGPLEGLKAGVTYQPYDWSNPSVLVDTIARFEPEEVTAGSSEGGLFEYASDADIASNLRLLADCTPAGFVMAGPVIRNGDTLDPRLKSGEFTPNRPAVRYLGLDAFGQIAASAGWHIDRHLDGPMHQVVLLVKG